MHGSGSGEKKRQSKPLMMIAIVLCLVGIGITAVLISRTITKQRAEARFAALSEEQTLETTASDEEVTEAVTKETEPAEESVMTGPGLPDGVTVPDRSIDWSSLTAENGDIYAWIYIPGTKVDYPILQDEDDLDYYLDHNLDHSKGYPGCIYTRYHNDKDFEDPNTVIYGHNMKDGSMFKTLHYYQDGAFFAQNPYIYIWQPGRVMVYEIFASYSFTDDDLLTSIDFDDPAIFRNYLDSLMAIRRMDVHLRHDTLVPLDEECKIVTLSTCIAGADTLRYLVQGVRVGMTEYGQQADTQAD